MKQTIRLTEGDFNRIIRKCVNEAVNKVVYPYHMQSLYGVKHPTDSVKGRFLRYSPEDSGFSSNDKWNKNKQYDAQHMIDLIDSANDSLSKAREYAFEMGHGNWYNLLNAILGELNDVVNREHGTGEKYCGKEKGWQKPNFSEFNPMEKNPW